MPIPTYDYTLEEYLNIPSFHKMKDELNENQLYRLEKEDWEKTFDWSQISDGRILGVLVKIRPGTFYFKDENEYGPWIDIYKGTVPLSLKSVIIKNEQHSRTI